MQFTGTDLSVVPDPEVLMLTVIITGNQVLYFLTHPPSPSLLHKGRSETFINQ